MRSSIKLWLLLAFLIVSFAIMVAIVVQQTSKVRRQPRPPVAAPASPAAART